MKNQVSPHLKTTTLAVLLAGVAGLSMGNTSCDAQTTPTRQLKMQVTLAPISAEPIQLPGQTIDFPTAINTLFEQEVMNNAYLTAVSATPAPTVAAAEMAVQTTPVAGLSAKDLNGLKAYGFVQAAPVAKDLPPANPDSSVPACEYNSPIGTVGGQVLSFQAEGGGGINIGYTSPTTATVPNTTLPPVLQGAGASINLTVSQLAMSMNWTNALENQIVAIEPSSSYQADINFAVTFTYGVPIGLNFFYDSPLTDVITSGIDQALSSLTTAYMSAMGQTSWNSAWESRVLYDPSINNGATDIAFWGGTLAGIEVGDTFTITNMNYQWSGTACSSNLEFEIPAASAVATATVVASYDNVTVATVTPLTQDLILPGAQVKVLALAAPTASPTPTP